MSYKSRFSLMAAMALLVLIFSAAIAVPAYADDSAPPPVDPTTVDTTPVVTDPVPVVVAPAVDAAPVDSAPSVDASAPAADQTAADILAQVPEGTNVVVVNKAGDTVPLASKEAAQAIVNGDPMWCPAGVTPNAGVGGCSGASFNGHFLANGSGLLDFLATNDPAKAGVIWIAYNYDGWASEPTTGAITLDGGLLNLPTMSGFALTIQGGWHGTNGSAALDATTPYSTLVNQLQITNWRAAVTLNNINVTLIGVNIASDDSALTVTTQGAITLNTVNTQNNADSDLSNSMTGATLDNTSSTTAAGVTINNSSFMGNKGSGLYITSKGIVTTKNIVASDNGQNGVYISNTYNTITDKAVTMTGIQQFNNNGLVSGYTGLLIYSHGQITLSNVVADNNGYEGVHLDNTGSLGHLGVTISGSNSILNNDKLNNYGAYGLVVKTYGSVLLNNINASGNAGDGVFVDNCNFSSGCQSPVGKTVTLTGTNVINSNGALGLEVYSFGSITLNNTTASNNGGLSGGAGAHLENDYASASGTHPNSLGTITLVGYGVFNNNNGDGLSANSYQKITVANLTANDNNANGANLENYFPSSKTASPITLTGSVQVNRNNGSGLDLVSWGAVTIANLTAVGNSSYGAYILNDNDPIAISLTHPKHTVQNGVTLSGVNTINDNNFNGDDGLYIASYGAILLSSISANYNGSYGIDLVNNYLNMAAVKPVTISGYTVMNYNSSDGMDINTNGAVMLANVTANNNGDYGVYISQGSATMQAGVTITGVNTFNGNIGASGLYISNYGPVVLSNVTADGNGNGSGDDGIYIDNTVGAGTPKPVTITGYVHTSGNFDEGLYIASDGVVILANVTANHNGSYGADIENTQTLQPGVTITGTNIFNNNSATNDGLYILSYGVIVLNNVTANDNLNGYGLYLDNTGGTAAKAVTIIGPLNVSGNGSDGAYVNSDGAVTLGNVLANNNSGNGITIYVSNKIQGSVTLSGVNTISNNTNYGLYISNYGAILLNSISANYNGLYGAYLDNTGGTLAKSITLTGVNTFLDNSGDGLYFNAHGTVTLNRVTASGNTNGATAGTPNGVTGTASGAITLVCGVMTGNEGKGYDLTGSTVTIKGIFTFGNGFVDTSSPAAVITRPCALP